MTAVDEGIKLAQHLPKGTIHRDMADEIVKLRAQLAGVRERVKKLKRWSLSYDGHMWTAVDGEYFDIDDVLAALGGDA